MKSETSNFLNLARWAAALTVVVGHVRQIVFVDFGSVEHPNALLKVFYFLTQLGHEAVMIFFVISGFLVGGKPIAHWRERKFDLGRYAAARISRIYIVLAPALLILGAFDLIGATWLNQSGLYAGAANDQMSSMGGAATDGLTLAALLANLGSVQGFYGIPPLGTNGPLWSLAYEWWYYCLFAAAFVGLTASSAGRRTIGAIAFLIMLAILPPKVILWGVIWLLGAAFGVLAEREARPLPLWIALPVFAAVIVGSRFTHTAEIDASLSTMQKFGVDLVVGASFGALVLAAPGGRIGNTVTQINRELAEFSYSLYLIHFPLMVFIVAALDRIAFAGFSAQPSASAFAYFAALSLMLCLSAWLFSKAFEARTPAARKWLERRFSRDKEMAFAD